MQASPKSLLVRVQWPPYEEAEKQAGVGIPEAAAGCRLAHPLPSPQILSSPLWTRAGGSPQRDKACGGAALYVRLYIAR